VALTNRTELLASIADWLNRADLTAQIPDFIALAEAEMKRELRRAVKSDTLAVSVSPTALPADCEELRSLYFETGQPWLDVPVKIGTVEQLAEQRARTAAIAGRPTHAAVIDNELHFAPEPDQTYTAVISYFELVPPLTVSNSTNRILTEAPDAYLFGALSQAAAFLQHDERIPLWQSRFEKAVLQLNARRGREEFGASLKPARLPRVF